MELHSMQNSLELSIQNSLIKVDPHLSTFHEFQTHQQRRTLAKSQRSDSLSSISNSVNSRSASIYRPPQELEEISRDKTYYEQDTEIEQTQEEHETKRDLRIFPLFGDRKLAEFSLNYLLYFEFYHVIIRFLWFLFGTSLLIYTLVDFIPKGDQFPEIIFPFSQFFKLMITEESPFHEDYGINVFIMSSIGASTGFLFTYFWRREKRRILASELLYDYQWSENLFSLRVEELPLNIKSEAVRGYFNALLSKEEIGGCVQDVILLQDCYSYCKQSRRLKLAQQNSQKAIDKNFALNALSKLGTELEIRSKLIPLEIGLREFKNFKGKAIVIFSTMRTKTKIMKYLTLSWYKVPFLIFGSTFLKNYYLNGQRITVKEIAEPKDLHFENLHYPKFKGAIRIVLAFILSLTVFSLGIPLIDFIEDFGNEESLDAVSQNEFKNNAKLYFSGQAGSEIKEPSEDDFMSWLMVLLKDSLCAIFVTISDHLLEKYYKHASSLRKTSSALHMDQPVLIFGLFLSIALYVVLQGLDIYSEPVESFTLENLRRKFVVLVIVFMLKTIITKMLLTRYNKPFEFIEGLSISFPILLVTLCFFAVSPF